MLEELQKKRSKPYTEWRNHGIQEANEDHEHLNGMFKKAIRREKRRKVMETRGMIHKPLSERANSLKQVKTSRQMCRNMCGLSVAVLVGWWKTVGMVSIFPQLSEEVTISPLYKKVDHADPANYRTVFVRSHHTMTPVG